LGCGSRHLGPKVESQARLLTILYGRSHRVNCQKAVLPHGRPNPRAGRCGTWCRPSGTRLSFYGVHLRVFGNIEAAADNGLLEGPVLSWLGDALCPNQHPRCATPRILASHRSAECARRSAPQCHRNGLRRGMLSATQLLRIVAFESRSPSLVTQEIYVSLTGEIKAVAIAADQRACGGVRQASRQIG